MFSFCTAGILTFLGWFLCFTDANGGPVITASPAAYIPKDNFTLKCMYGGTGEELSDIISITIGKRGNNPFAMAGISEDEGTLVSHQIKERASASGVLNHTHFRESYIDLHLNDTSCSDLDIYYCSMAVVDNIIVHAVKSEFKYSLKEGESCLQIDTSSGQEDVRTRPAIILSTFVVISGFLRMRHWITCC